MAVRCACSEWYEPILFDSGGCPACKRKKMLAEDSARIASVAKQRAALKQSEAERQAAAQQAAREHAAWVRQAARSAYFWGYNIDKDVAKYAWIMNEDGSLRYECEPHPRYHDSQLRDLIIDGFFARMSEYRFEPADFDFLRSQAQRAGRNSACHSGFHIDHVSEGFTFQLYRNPEVHFVLEGDTLTAYRNKVFSTQLMADFDKGLAEYKERNLAELKVAAESFNKTLRKERDRNTFSTILILIAYALATVLWIPLVSGSGRLWGVFSLVNFLVSIGLSWRERWVSRPEQSRAVVSVKPVLLSLSVYYLIIAVIKYVLGSVGLIEWG